MSAQLGNTGQTAVPRAITNRAQWPFDVDAFEEDFKKCPTCGYRDGFHTMLKRIASGIKWLFICPSCHDVFDVGIQQSE